LGQIDLDKGQGTHAKKQTLMGNQEAKTTTTPSHQNKKRNKEVDTTTKTPAKKKKNAPMIHKFKLDICFNCHHINT
jgi:hypothetical protein